MCFVSIFSPEVIYFNYFVVLQSHFDFSRHYIGEAIFLNHDNTVEMIQSHLYARKSETPVYIAPAEDGMPVHILHPGDWVGELAREADWIHVIGVEGDGWVRAEDLEERPPFQLHAFWTAGKAIEYINVGD